MKDTLGHHPSPPIPPAALVLGLAGVIPFGWGALTELSPAVQDWGNRALGQRFTGQYVLIFYGTIILSFMSGVLWGFAARTTGRAAAFGFAVSVIPALWAFFFVGGGEDRATWFLIMGYLGLLSARFRVLAARACACVVDEPAQPADCTGRRLPHIGAVVLNMTETLKLYAMRSSGNSYKIELMLAHLGRPHDLVAMEYGDAALARAKADGTLPLGKLPTLHLPDGTVLSESGAILWYLAQGTDWIPTDPLEHAQMLAWMFFEQNRIESVIAVRAALLCYPHFAAGATPDRLASLLNEGHALLAILDATLAGCDWLVGDRPTLADIAVYGYVHSSGSRGGYDMGRFANVTAWCARMTALPGHVTLMQPG